MDEKNEDIDSQNDAEDTVNVNEEEVADTEYEETEDTKPEYTNNEKKLYARMKKAEADSKLAKEELAKKSTEKPTPVSEIDKLLEAKLEQRDLESLELSDELKEQVSTYAKVQGVSVKKALKSDFIVFQLEKEEKEEKLDDASLSSKRKGTVKKDYSEMKSSDFDLRTEEGRKGFSDYRKSMKKELDG